MPSITQNNGNSGAVGVALPAMENLDLHCVWARFFDQPQYGYARTQFSDDTLCYFQAGSGWVQLTGHERQVWQAPCILLFRQTQWYAAQSPGAIQAHSLHFRCELPGRPPVSLMDLMDLPPVLPAALTAGIAPLIAAMTAEYLNRQLASQWVLDGQLRLLLAQLVRQCWPAAVGTDRRTGTVETQPDAEQTARPAARGLLRLAPALTWMAAHISEPQAVDRVAAEVGLTAGHFRALFKKTFRTTPAQYLIHLRMDRAKRLLLTSDWTVSQIADRLGFAYPHYFIRQFKQTTGQTPAAWRTANAR